MRHDIAPPLKRAAVNWCGEGVVNNKRHTVAVGNACELLNVEHLTARVGDCLAEESLCVGTEGSLNLFVGCLWTNERTLDSKFLQCNSKEVERSAIYLV